MGIDPIKFKMFNQTQGVNKVKGLSQAQSVQGASHNTGGSLVERLNSMDNKLNQGGGVSLNSSVSGAAGGQDEIIKKLKLMG